MVDLSETRIAAMQQTAKYYVELYDNNPKFQKSRESFAMKENTLPDLTKREHLADFYFWTAWTASAERPGTGATYTNNWPHEPLIDNNPTAENVIWSIASVVFLIAGMGFLVWGWSFLHHDEAEVKLTVPKRHLLSLIDLTPSQKALAKYAFLVMGLFVVQIFLGGLIAQYTVEGQDFYGIHLSEFIPYSLARTWHIQAVLFWVATAFLAVGLFVTPILNGGKDPKFQKLGVDILWVALIIVCLGFFAGQYLAIHQIMPDNLNFWFGHQGYEFIDIGRFWQIWLSVHRSQHLKWYHW